MNNLLEHQQKLWAPVVGNFIIEFGHLETSISEVVKLSVLPAQFKILNGLSFSKKAELAKAALEFWIPSEIELINDDFSKLKNITERRNIVAHNGISVAIYLSDEDGINYEFCMSRNYKASEVLLQIKDLQSDIELLKIISKNIIEWICKSKDRN